MNDEWLCPLRSLDNRIRRRQNARHLEWPSVAILSLRRFLAVSAWVVVPYTIAFFELGLLDTNVVVLLSSFRGSLQVFTDNRLHLSHYLLSFCDELIHTLVASLFSRLNSYDDMQ